MLFLVDTNYIMLKNNDKSLQQVTLLFQGVYKPCPKQTLFHELVSTWACLCYQTSTQHYNIYFIRQNTPIFMLLLVGTNYIMPKNNNKSLAMIIAYVCKQCFWQYYNIYFIRQNTPICMLFLVGISYIIPKTNNKFLQPVILLFQGEYKICLKCSSISWPGNHHLVGVLIVI